MKTNDQRLRESEFRPNLTAEGGNLDKPAEELKTEVGASRGPDTREPDNKTQPH